VVGGPKIDLGDGRVEYLDGQQTVTQCGKRRRSLLQVAVDAFPEIGLDRGVSHGPEGTRQGTAEVVLLVDVKLVSNQREGRR
jgi:hypothetical protein